MTPPTYPARPRNGGPLDFALKAGMYPKREDVTFQPKFNGWRAQVHTPTGRMWNRYNQPFHAGIHADFKTALAQLKACPFEWLDVEGLERRHKVAAGCLIVLDWIIPGVEQHARYALLEHFFDVALVGGEEWFEAGTYVVPQHDLAIYKKLQKRNEELGCVFYEGVVTKEVTSHYPLQMRSAAELAPSWIKHRFTTV